jgi:hypothetical protein
MTGLWNIFGRKDSQRLQTHENLEMIVFVEGFLS